jgi:hypothetical protein
MTRSTKVIFSAGTLFVCLSVAYVWQLHNAQPPPVPSLNDALQISESGRPTRLYSGKLEAKTGQPLTAKDQSYDVLRGNVKVASFLLNKDKTSRDTFYKDDGVGLTFVREYYPLLAADVGRRPKGLVIYAADGKTIKSETWWRLDGTREKIGNLLATGRYQTTILFADGNTAQSVKITAPNPYANNFEPKLIQEKRWYPNAAHTLAWIDQLNDDETRDQSSFDEYDNPLMVKHIGRWGKVGTAVKLFYPGTTKVRLESVTDAAITLVTARRLDGSFIYKQQLTAYSSTTRYLDADGKALFEQSRWKDNVVENGKPKEVWPLWKIDEFGETANTILREFSWTSGKLTTETRFNFTVDGVFYEKVIFNFRDDGTLQRVDMLGPKARKRVVEYTVEQNVRAVVPANEQVEQERNDAIPMPEPQSYGYGGH